MKKKLRNLWEWIKFILIIMIIPAIIGLGVSWDIYKWHKTEEIVGHKIGYLEYHAVFKNSGRVITNDK